MSLDDKVVFGGLYKAKNLRKVWGHTSSGLDRNNQRYDLWIPIRFTGSDRVDPGIYMIDTYQVESIYGSYNKVVERLISFGEDGNQAYYNASNFYYNSRIRLTEEILDEFELIADLREWHKINTDDVGDYLQSDVLKYVRLYREHNYPNGIHLVRNDADINPWNHIECLCDQISELHVPSLTYKSVRAKQELERYLETLDSEAEYNKERVEAVLELYDKIEKLTKGYETEYKDLRNRAANTTRYEWAHDSEKDDE